MKHLSEVCQFLTYFFRKTKSYLLSKIERTSSQNSQSNLNISQFHVKLWLTVYLTIIRNKNEVSYFTSFNVSFK